MKNKRKVIAVNELTGQCEVYGSVYDFAKKKQNITVTAAQNALTRGWACAGWMLYDTPDRIREEIERMEQKLKYVESLAI